jgi:hypothetical protein
MNINYFKSIRAIVAGFITVVVLSVGTDFFLEALGIFPPIDTGLFIPWMLVLAFVYRSIYAVAGGYVTAAAAPHRAMVHVIILGIIGTIAGAIGVIVGWNRSSHWYPIALAATALPWTWFGGKLKIKFLSKK